MASASSSISKDNGRPKNERSEIFSHVRRQFLNSPVSINVDPIDLLDAFMKREILDENEAEIIRLEENLLFRQYALFEEILPRKQNWHIDEIGQILQESNYLEAANEWSKFLDNYVIIDFFDHPDVKDGSTSSIASLSPLQIQPQSAIVKNTVGSILSVLGNAISELFISNAYAGDRRPSEERDRISMGRFTMPTNVTYEGPPIPISHSIPSKDIVIEKLIGEGQFSHVHEGRYRNMRVAIKKFKKTDFDSFTDRMFREEVAIMEKLDHPNIVRYQGCVYEIARQNIWILTELIEGDDLRRFCPPNQNSLNLQQKIRIALECWKGLCYLHEQGICHRDISPSNILVTHNGEVKICDFGLSRFKNLTVWSGKLYGKLYYQAPEYYFPTRSSDWFLTDVYSMGATLCEFISGSFVWKIADRTTNGKLKTEDQIWAELVDKMRSQIFFDCWNSVQPKEIQEIMINAIHRDFDQRKSALDMMKMTENYLNGITQDAV